MTEQERRKAAADKLKEARHHLQQAEYAVNSARALADDLPVGQWQFECGNAFGLVRTIQHMSTEMMRASKRFWTAPKKPAPR